MGNISNFKFKFKPFDFLRDLSFVFWFATEYTVSHSLVAQIAVAFFCIINTLDIVRFRLPSKTFFCRTLVLFWIFIVVCYLNIVFEYSINPNNSYFLLSALFKNGIFLIFAYHYITIVGIEKFKNMFVLSAVLTSALLLGVTLFTYNTLILRGDSELVNANVLAVIDTFAVCWILSDLEVKNSRILVFFTIAILVLFCICSGSKKVILGFGIWVAAYLGLKNPGKIFTNTIKILLFLGFGYFIIMKIPAIYNSIGIRIENLLLVISGDVGDRSSVVRYDLVIIGWEMFKESPILGQGINCFYTVNGYGLYAHNNYIELLYSLGIIGIISFYSIHMSFLVSGFKRFKNSRNKNVIIGIAFVFFILATDIGLVSYFDRSSQILLLICNALIIDNSKDTELM